MKIRKFFGALVAAMATLVACDEAEVNLGTPDISISVAEMTFDIAGGDKDLTVTATRDWKVEGATDWVVVSPSSGTASASAKTVTVSVLENTGLDRTVDLVFTIGLKKKYLTVSQAGPAGSASDLIVYKNDFDISKAQNNSGWPYLDSNYDLWDNKIGTGSSTVVYEFGGKMSVRTSGKASNDGSGFSHYSGSGTNKVFFGAATSILKITKITLNGTQTDFALSFGGQKYLQDGDSKFSWNEFKVYVSNDAQKWVELNMAFPEGADVDGDWNLASANFTVPAGTAELGLAFVSTCGSAYSIDDVLLENGKAGQVIDFSTGIAIEGTTAGSGNGGNNDNNNSEPAEGQPSSLVKVTVQEFLAAAEDDTWYELTGEIINIAKTDYGNFTIKDETGEVYIYGMTSKWVGTNDKSFSQIGLKVSDVVTLGTKRTSYQGTPQGGGNTVPAYYISHVPGEGGEEPEPPVTGEEGEFDPQLTWSLGTSSYDKTSSGTSAQTATVNGVSVSNLLKLGKSSAGGEATVNIPEGTAKVGFYAVAWANNNSTVLTCNVGGQDVALNIKANSGASGNPPYTITLTESDYYEVEIPSGVTSMKMSTAGTSNCRALIFALKAVAE